MNPSPLHLRVARNQLWSRRATFAGLGALAGSGLALLLGLSGPLHLAALALGGLVGLAWPQPSAERRALRWVGERAGLAYETAWETAERDDPQGLLDAVRTQGRLTIRALRMPNHTPWWAPAMVLSLAMWLMASLGALPQGGSLFGGGSFQEPLGSQPPTGSPAAATDDGAEPPADELPPPPVEAGGGAPTGTPGAGQGGAGTESIGGQGGEATDRDALERFVEGLRNRPQEEEGEATQAAVPVAPGDEGEGEEGDPEGEGTRESDGTPGDGSGQAGESEGGGEGDADQDGDQAGQGEDGDEQAGQEGDPAGGQGDAPAGSDDAEAGQGQQQGQGAGEAGLDAFDAGEGDEGGLGGGTPAEVPMALGLEGDLADPQSLEGLLGAGPEQVVGGLMLPGYGEDGAAFLAPGGAASYQRAVEQALIDGDLPVPYQEVIRNYFR